MELIFAVFLFMSSSSLLGQTSQVDSVSHNEFLDMIDLDEVVITSTRTEKTLMNTPVITQVITARQIENRGIADIKNLLMQEVPGLSFQEVGFGTSINMQGLDAKHILFLIDGERIAGETGNNIDYSRLNLYNVERIEIVKGAASAIYGSQAMGGVINIITKNAKKKVELDVGGRLGEFNQRNFPNPSKEDNQYTYQRNADKPNLNENISLGLNLGKLKSQTDVLYKSFDGYQLYDRDSITKYYPELDTTIIMNRITTPSSISGYDDITISQKLSYTFNDKLKLSVRGSYYELNKYDFTQNNKFENNVDFSYRAQLDYAVNRTSNLILSYFADNYERFDKYELIEGKDLSYRNGLMQPKVLFSTTSLRNQTLTTGIEFLQESLYGDKFDSNQLEEKTQRNATAFVQDDWEIKKDLNLIGGVRVDYHEKYSWNVSPKLSLLYRMFPFTLRLNYASGYRSPSLKELYMDWDHLGMFRIYGNENLKPETNHYVSLSGEYVSSHLYATLTGYGNKFSEKIEGIWSNNQTEYRYTNIGNTTLAGIEATARVKIVRGLFFNGMFNYLYSKNEEGVRLTTASPLSGNMRLEYGFSKKKYNANFNLSSSFIGEKNYDVSDEIVINGITRDAFYKAHTPAYSIWNFAFTQNFYDTLRLTVGVDNLLDYKAGIINFNTYTSPGRMFYVTMNLRVDELANILNSNKLIK